MKLTQKTKSNRTTQKAYGVLLTCRTVRAVHSDLSADIFTLTLRHFISRCYKPKELLSDNGMNFIGAGRELGKALHDLNQ